MDDPGDEREVLKLTLLKPDPTKYAVQYTALLYCDKENCGLNHENDIDATGFI